MAHSVKHEDYGFLCRVLHREAGISLGDDKKYLVEARLGELCRTMGVGSLDQLVSRVREGQDPTTLKLVVEAMTTNETSFFRDQAPFEALRDRIIPGMLTARAATRRLRIWSAACSTGQEPYSLAITLLDHFPQLASWDVSILATDLAEQKVLERAQQGRFTQHEVNRGLPARSLVKHFEQRDDAWFVKEPTRRLVKFQKVNLLDIPRWLGEFDLVLCRNVLIYFDVDTKQKVLGRIHSHLAKDGCLMIGASEILFGVTESFRRETYGRTSYYLRD